MDRLILLDGTGLAYRAFFAIPPLTAADGSPTNALYGFIRVLHAMGASWSPSHWAVVWDGGVPERRRTAWPEYKANRPGMPPELWSQMPLIDDFLDRAKICRVRVEGQEADDVLASIVARARAAADRVLVATSDKDLLQLVDDRVHVVAPARGTETTGPDEVLARLGVRPDQVVDWLALSGDQADNIPGVPGLGAKTAAKLLATYGSLGALWARLDEVTPARVREALRVHREVVARNAALVRLDDAIDCVPAWTAMARQPEPYAEVAPFYERMGFHSLVRAAQEPRLL